MISDAERYVATHICYIRCSPEKNKCKNCYALKFYEELYEYRKKLN